MTPEEFEAGYAERSGITVEQLRRVRTVRRCTCGEDGCDGYASISISFASDWDAWAPRSGAVAGSVIPGLP